MKLLRKIIDKLSIWWICRECGQMWFRPGECGRCGGMTDEKGDD